MPLYEYKVIPAPRKGERARGVRSAEARFALTLQDVMNEQADEGWEYQRSDTLPCEQRKWMFGRTVVEQTMLIFRRAVEVEAELGDMTEYEADQPQPEAEAGHDRPAPGIEPLVLEARIDLPTLGGVSRKMREQPASAGKRAAARVTG
jgi:hypothetical protein